MLKLYRLGDFTFVLRFNLFVRRAFRVCGAVKELCLLLSQALGRGIGEAQEESLSTYHQPDQARVIIAIMLSYSLVI